jgi:hypothetical protein
MLRWSNVVAREARNEELRIEAAHEQWVRSMMTETKQQPRFYHAIAFQLGCWMTSVGQRLQQRYKEIVEPTFTPKIGSNQGAC